MSDNYEIKPSDLVLVNLTVRARDTNEPYALNDAIRVADLPFSPDGSGGSDIDLSFDSGKFATLMSSGSNDDTQEALRMQADHLERTAQHVAAGGRPQSERLADAIVQWAVDTQPGGNVFTTDTESSEGYILNKNEFNIQGPLDLGDEERGWKASAVGTWG